MPLAMFFLFVLYFGESVLHVLQQIYPKCAYRYSPHFLFPVFYYSRRIEAFDIYRKAL
jgi:hypothetical protein